MKKIIPILSILTIPALMCACNTDQEKANIDSQTCKTSINQFQRQFDEYSNINDQHLNKLNLNKYRLTINTNNEIDMAETQTETDNKTNDDNQNSTSNTDTELQTETPQTDVLDEQQPTVLPTDDTDQTESSTNDENDAGQTNKDNSDISTFYSISDDVDSECDNFCQLKKQLVNAIVETQNLIDKVNNNEIDLSNEQRIFLTEQATQLKNLGKRLSIVTNELNFSVSDLGKLINSNADLNDVNLKYLLVLNSLSNGNAMLQDGLYSLNMIKQLMHMQNGFVGNNYGRILYGFAQNGNPPVVYDYTIDKDGNITSNKSKDENNQTDTETQANADTKSIEQPTNKGSWLTPNVNSYGNLNSNIDTFYNTALLNKFGRNNFGYGNFGNFYAPNMYGYPANYAYGNNSNMGYPNPNYNTQPNTTNGVNNDYNTPYGQPKTNKHSRKKFAISKNIDTYKTEKTLSPKQRFAKIKQSVETFFSKLNK